MSLALEGGKTLRVEVDHVDKRGPSDFSWFSKPNPRSNAQFVVRNGKTFGTIRSGADTYQVRPSGNGHIIVKLDYAALPAEHPPAFRQVEAASRSKPQAGPFDVRDTVSTIELLVAYTPKVRAATSDVGALVQLAVDEANVANSNSKVKVKFHLAHSYEIDYTESGDYDKDLKRFRENNDGFMDGVHALRDQHAADVAVLIFDNDDYCGMASDIKANASNAFAVVHYSCATGYYSFAHEIGHLMGARHDPAADPSTTPFAYGHGFQHASAGGTDTAWRTVMAYNCSPSCTRVQQWSNPNVTFNGYATGTAATHDNARVLNETAATVAGFRESSSPNPTVGLWHTMRRPNGSWTGLGDVNGQFSIPGPVRAVAATASNPGETQYAFATDDGHLWHTMRRPNGSWTGLGDVNGQFAIPGPVRAIAGTRSNPSETQFIFATEDGHLWHTMRRPNGSWSGLGDVNGQFAIPGPVRAVAAATSNPGETQYLFATADGHLWHTMRRPNGSWTGLGDVNGQFAIPGPVRAVAATGSNPSEAQFLFATEDGHLWHTMRRPNGSWTGLGDVNGQFAIPGPVRAVAATTSNPSETQFMFATEDGHLWHTMRRPNGSWSGLGDVNGQFAIPAAVKATAAATSNGSETQFLFTTR